MDKKTNMEIIDAIRNDDVRKIENMKKNINLKSQSENLDTFLHYSCTFGSYRCAYNLVDIIDPLTKNSNNFSPIDLLQLKYSEHKDNLHYKRLLEKIKQNIKTRNLENIISRKIFNCLRFKLYNEIDYLLKLIDLQYTNSIIYLSNEKKELSTSEFLHLAYQMDDKKFYSLLMDNGLIIKNKQKKELEKIALFDMNYDWYSLLNKEVYYDHNSKEVLLKTTELLNIC